MSHVKSYAWEIEMAQFQNGSKSRSRVFLLRWLTFWAISIFLGPKSEFWEKIMNVITVNHSYQNWFLEGSKGFCNSSNKRLGSCLLSAHIISRLSLRAGIHGPSGLGTDLSESVRDFQNFVLVRGSLLARSIVFNLRRFITCKICINSNWTHWNDSKSTKDKNNLGCNLFH